MDISVNLPLLKRTGDEELLGRVGWSPQGWGRHYDPHLYPLDIKPPIQPLIEEVTRLARELGEAQAKVVQLMDENMRLGIEIAEFIEKHND